MSFNNFFSLCKCGIEYSIIYDQTSLNYLMICDSGFSITNMMNIIAYEINTSVDTEKCLSPAFCITNEKKYVISIA